MDRCECIFIVLGNNGYIVHVATSHSHFGDQVEVIIEDVKSNNEEEGGKGAPLLHSCVGGDVIVRGIRGFYDGFGGRKSSFSNIDESWWETCSF